MTDTDRNSILDAVNVLNDLVNDLIAGTMVFDRYQSKFTSGEFSQPGIVAVQKMCVSHLILGLNKICEFWEIFHDLVPVELKSEVIEHLNRISDNDPSGFLLWLNNPNDNDYPKTVVSIVVTLRDHLRELHNITSDEIFKR
jgi:hypothetical protein